MVLTVLYIIYKAGHAWLKEGSLLRTILEKGPRGRLRWEDRVKKKTCENIKPRKDCKELSLERESWRQICWTVWSQRPKTIHKNRK